MDPAIVFYITQAIFPPFVGLRQSQQPVSDDAFSSSSSND